MTDHDNMLTQGSERPERDEDAFSQAIDGCASDFFIRDEHGHLVGTIYDALPALTYAMREVVFPVEMRPYITALTKLATDIRAKVDDEYKSLTETYNDPRD